MPIRFIFLLLPLFFVSFCVGAQDVSLLAGAMQVQGGARSFGVGLGYTQRMGAHTAVGLEYVNEGHPPQHHRDGLGPVFWLHTAVPSQGWSVAIGAGPYYFFDTTRGAGAGPDYRNAHGWGEQASLSARWHLRTRTYAEARLTHIHGRTGHDSNLLLVGLGYELGEFGPRERERTAGRGDHLLLAQVGRATVNSFRSETATAGALAYHHTLTPNAEWSAMLLSEGRIGHADRRGVAAQAWLLRPFTERTVLALGGGGYLMHDEGNRVAPGAPGGTHLSPLASIAMRWRLGGLWRAQLSWSRVITRYHQDADLFLLGLGQVF